MGIGPNLSQIGRRQVRSDPLLRIFESRVDQSGPDPLPGFTNCRVGQADEREDGQAPADVDLDLDRAGFDAHERECPGGREHGLRLGTDGARVARQMSRICALGAACASQA